MLKQIRRVAERALGHRHGGSAGIDGALVGRRALDARPRAFGAGRRGGVVAAAIDALGGAELFLRTAQFLVPARNGVDRHVIGVGGGDAHGRSSRAMGRRLSGRRR
jgi:hypothetical protein